MLMLGLRPADADDALFLGLSSAGNGRLMLVMLCFLACSALMLMMLGLRAG